MTETVWLVETVFGLDPRPRYLAEPTDDHLERTTSDVWKAKPFASPDEARAYMEANSFDPNGWDMVKHVFLT